MPHLIEQDLRGTDSTCSRILTILWINWCVLPMWPGLISTIPYASRTCDKQRTCIVQDCPRWIDCFPKLQSDLPLLDLTLRSRCRIVCLKSFVKGYPIITPHSGACTYIRSWSQVACTLVNPNLPFLFDEENSDALCMPQFFKPAIKQQDSLVLSCSFIA